MSRPDRADDVASAEHTLRRTGARPVSFRGVQVCAASSEPVRAPFWYEVNLFRLVDGSFVVDIRRLSRDGRESPKHTVLRAESFDAAATALETYDPTRDLRAPNGFDDPGVSAADLTFQALGLRARIDEARAQYGALVGEVLADLEQTSLEAAGGQRLT